MARRTKKPAIRSKSQPSAAKTQANDISAAQAGTILAKKAVLAHVKIGRWMARKFDGDVTAEVHRNHNATDAGRFNKRLVSNKAMADITRLATEARRFHYTHTQPWFDGGARILPSAHFQKYSTEMQRLRQEYEVAADQFERDYPTILKQAQAQLNGLFNKDDYPAPNAIRKMFEISVTVQPCPDTADFRIALADEHVDDVRRELERRMAEALLESQRDIVSRITGVVTHMAEKLRAYEPGEEEGDKAKGIFRDSLVENVRDLADLLPGFNYSGDARMDEITERIKRHLCERDADELRDDENARKEVAGNAESILEDVKQFMA